jgi:hypothetical protein
VNEKRTKIKRRRKGYNRNGEQYMNKENEKRNRIEKKRTRGKRRTGGRE